MLQKKMTLLSHSQSSLEPTWRKSKKMSRKHDRRATSCSTEPLAKMLLGNKVHKIVEISSHCTFLHISIVCIKMIKIDFFNNQIVEIKKKMTFQVVFMYN